MRTLPVRIAVTPIVPIAVYVINRYVSVPGLDAGMPMGRVGGVFTLGVMPAITAYALVELVASLVPRWNRFRHGDPTGRTKLERVARVVAVLFATMQAFAIGRQLALLGDSPFFGSAPAPSVGIVTATLVAGACVAMVAADWISRQGIANGYVLLVVGGELVDLEQSIAGGLRNAERVGPVQPIQHLWLVLGIGLALFASALVLRGANDVRVGKKDAGGAPYRKASALAIHPWLPLPLSSFAPYPIAVSLLSVPPLFHVQVFDTMSNTSFLTILFAIVAVLASLLARVLHRPNELGEVASRLGVSTSKLEKARSRAMPPTLLFFLVLLVASAVAGGSRYARVGVMTFPLPGRSGKSYYVRVMAQPGETPDAVLARATKWAGTLSLPPDRRIAWEDETEVDDEGANPRFTGVRTVMITGASILTTADVVSADAMVANDVQNEPYVAIQLSDAAAARFAEATGAHIDERIAILLDGRVNSAPVVKSRITGGRVSITMGSGRDPKEQLQKAQKLAASLGPRP